MNFGVSGRSWIITKFITRYKGSFSMTQVRLRDACFVMGADWPMGGEEARVPFPRLMWPHSQGHMCLCGGWWWRGKAAAWRGHLCFIRRYLMRGKKIPEEIFIATTVPLLIYPLRLFSAHFEGCIRKAFLKVKTWNCCSIRTETIFVWQFIFTAFH